MSAEGQFECEACLARVDELFNGYCKVCDGYEFCESCENLFDPSEMILENCRYCDKLLSVNDQPKTNN